MGGARSADDQHATVESEASSGGLFSFDAIAYDFPFGATRHDTSYAMGTTMVDMIIDDYGEDAIARIAEAYRAGASDDEALQDGTGRPCRPAVRRLLRRVRRRRARPVEPAPSRHPMSTSRAAPRLPARPRANRRRRRPTSRAPPGTVDGRANRCRRRRGRPGDPGHRRVRRLVGAGAVAGTGSRRERHGQPRADGASASRPPGASRSRWRWRWSASSAPCSGTARWRATSSRPRRSRCWPAR